MLKSMSRLSGRAACGVTTTNGMNTLLLIFRGLIPRLHFALSSNIPPRARRGGQRVRVHFRQHIPRPPQVPSTSHLLCRLYSRMSRLGAGRPRLDQPLTSRGGRLRPYAAATDGRAQLTASSLDTSPWANCFTSII